MFSFSLSLSLSPSFFIPLFLSSFVLCSSVVAVDVLCSARIDSVFHSLCLILWLALLLCGGVLPWVSCLCLLSSINFTRVQLTECIILNVQCTWGHSTSFSHSRSYTRATHTEKPFSNGTNWTKNTAKPKHTLTYFNGLSHSNHIHHPNWSDYKLCLANRKKAKNNYRKAHGFVCCQPNRQRYKRLRTPSNCNQTHTLIHVYRTNRGKKTREI